MTRLNLTGAELLAAAVNRAQIDNVSRTVP
jgi:hypothetical protein